MGGRTDVDAAFGGDCVEGGVRGTLNFYKLDYLSNDFKTKKVYTIPKTIA